ncbi:hypothetical protein L0C21_07755 [Sphingosinicellaceae bacterium A1X5R2]|nr:hypothetical protein [Pedomonas mirosovicensis]MCH8685170.1 hypothetical protein [Pedomonas mirosovicensis]
MRKMPPMMSATPASRQGVIGFCSNPARADRSMTREAITCPPMTATMKAAAPSRGATNREVMRKIMP